MKIRVRSLVIVGLLLVLLGASATQSRGWGGPIIAWGEGHCGQCEVPEPNTDFVAVATGACHSLALRSDGSMVAWGDDNYGACSVPDPNTDFVSISAGELLSLGLKSDGSIVAWGYGGAGQCTIPEPNNCFVSVAAGYRHSLGLKRYADDIASVPIEGGHRLSRGPELTATPNPAAGPVLIRYRLATDGHVTLQVFDATGALIRRLWEGPQSASTHDALWDGRDDAGNAVPAGVYLLRIATTTGRTIESVVLAR